MSSPIGCEAVKFRSIGKRRLLISSRLLPRPNQQNNLIRHCSTRPEIVLAIIAEAFGGFLFGMLIGSLSSHITAGNISEQEYNRQMDTIREFLRCVCVAS
eukprot:SAG31_NODE_3126_length_4646_cov_6.852210_2_plen_100_part_00